MQRTAVRTAGCTGEIMLESAEAGGMMQMAADQDELVSSAKAHRLLGWRPRHLAFADHPELHCQHGSPPSPLPDPPRRVSRLSSNDGG
ncbi:hypothetical protein GQF42_03000 [Streptomyces broussonetiae]|uniref:Uncharacterized protein n=1 Tax=Streptomyces broussonetiae TaxID=2686304 RepID=A0A6I6MTQ2_9ACTN|nr:hypothetical protein [Streptomyces broussonetiae]QHA02394.1 hypothetical protein GQF42_03000 [Streptomyces broussonetiae]